MKRFIDVHIPINKCNLRCHYCYVTQTGDRDIESTPFSYSIETIKKALTVERLGGICHFNLCGLGETLIPKETFDITKALLENGHYVFIVTNCTLKNRLEQYFELPEELKKRLGFKCSFHYLELKKRNMLDGFFDNIDLIRKNNISFSLELTPSDELEPYINEIMKICLKRVGALCHVTIPRDMTKSDIVLLSKHSFKEFYKIWSVFESEMFEFKSSLWEQKRREFCYAGEWSGLLNVGNGLLNQCYGKGISQNILENPELPIKWCPIGHNCSMPHCYNSHSLLGLGDIPSIKGSYALERDRVDSRDGSHWLNKEMREFLNHRLGDYNDEYNTKKMKQVDLIWNMKVLENRIFAKGKRVFKKLILNK